MKRTIKAVLHIGAFALLMAPDTADAIPAFARKYNVSCSLCHAPAPRLTEFGETFAGNGFEMTPGEAPRDTIDTGDPLLRLLRRIEIAFRLDMFANATTPLRAAEPNLDLQTPYNLKLLSGGSLANKISYYLYFFMGERGEVAGLEDAYVQFTDIAGSGVNVIAGQFQVSDPLFKRETRLEYDDYSPYRFRVGDSRVDLTYDRGLFATYSPWENGDLAVILVNGSGINTADDDRQYDTDALKNVAVRFSQGLGALRLGGYAYFGEERAVGQSNQIRYFGPDATLSAGNVELNLQYLRRTDSNPFYDAVDDETEVNSAMAELIWSPGGPTGRWHVASLYNWIDSDEPIVHVRMGNEDPVTRHQALSSSLHYLLARNVRVLGELGYDFERERTRLTAGVFLAF